MTPELKDFRVKYRCTDNLFSIIAQQTYLQADPKLLRWRKALWVAVLSGGETEMISYLEATFAFAVSFREDTVVEDHWCSIRHTSMWFCDTKKNCMMIRLLDAIPACWLMWKIWAAWEGLRESLDTVYGAKTLGKEETVSGGKMMQPDG